MRFSATEVGFDNGLGGASNGAGTEEYHYVLFGIQNDEQHQHNSGVYFEFDDQINGGIDQLKRIIVRHRSVEFRLTLER
jgi:hypothetical protein